MTDHTSLKYVTKDSEGREVDSRVVEKLTESTSKVINLRLNGWWKDIDGKYYYDPKPDGKSSYKTDKRWLTEKTITKIAGWTRFILQVFDTENPSRGAIFINTDYYTDFIEKLPEIKHRLDETIFELSLADIIDKMIKSGLDLETIRNKILDSAKKAGKLTTKTHIVIDKLITKARGLWVWK